MQCLKGDGFFVVIQGLVLLYVINQSNHTYQSTSFIHFFFCFNLVFDSFIFQFLAKCHCKNFMYRFLYIEVVKKFAP